MDKAIEELRETGLELEDQGDIKDYLGINFQYSDDGKIIMSQPQLIDSIIRDLQIKNPKNVPEIPALSTQILGRNENSPPFDENFHYRSVVGKLNYLEKGTRPDIAYATHQCARFCQDPRAPHGKAMEHLVRYLQGTRDKGIILTPNKNKSVEVFADADFSEDWSKITSEFDVSTAKSRTEFVVMYAGCPIIWTSKLQTQVALSTT